jgi:hypothetical protein
MHTHPLSCLVLASSSQRHATETSGLAAKTYFLSDLVEVQCSSPDTALALDTEVHVKRFGKGRLRYAGMTDGASTPIFGVELNDPIGLHDGEVEGQRYFYCQPNHGVLVGFIPSCVG